MLKLTRRSGLGLLLAALAVPNAQAAEAQEQSYGAHPSQRLDVYPRVGLRGAPVLLFVHGGGWRRGDKRMVHALPAYAERHGFLLLSANYRMAPEVDAGGCAEDVAGAFAWAKANAARFGGDPGRIFLVGHSAGAHLVALIAVDGAYLGRHRLAPRDIAGVIPLDGAGYDAVQQLAYADSQSGRPIYRRLEDMYVQAFGARAAALSPTLLVKPGQSYPPILILYVGNRPDSSAQSQGLAAALRRAGGQALALASSDATHGDINSSFGAPGDPEGELGAAFIKTGRIPTDARLPAPAQGQRPRRRRLRQ